MMQFCYSCNSNTHHADDVRWFESVSANKKIEAPVQSFKRLWNRLKLTLMPQYEKQKQMRHKDWYDQYDCLVILGVLPGDRCQTKSSTAHCWSNFIFKSWKRSLMKTNNKKHGWYTYRKKNQQRWKGTALCQQGKLELDTAWTQEEVPGLWLRRVFLHWKEKRKEKVLSSS